MEGSSLTDGLGWSEFSAVEPELAMACRSLMYQYGVGLAFLATVRRDGGPRVHLMCPLIGNHGLFAFLIPSPKRGDLHRDPRYAMHSFPAEENEDAFYLTGRAGSVGDPGVRGHLQDQFLEERGLSLGRTALRSRSCSSSRSNGASTPSPPVMEIPIRDTSLGGQRQSHGPCNPPGMGEAWELGKRPLAHRGSMDTARRNRLSLSVSGGRWRI